MTSLPPIRSDLSLSEGYHSPQVEAEVRLNTNESPFAPPEQWSRDLLEALAEVGFHRYPDRPGTAWGCHQGATGNRALPCRHRSELSAARQDHREGHSFLGPFRRWEIRVRLSADARQAQARPSARR